jgi:sulfide:quinone oxidoreductase
MSSQSPGSMLTGGMGHPPSSRSQAHVVIVGGGFAALETMIALRALAAERVAMTLISPRPFFFYRPAATAEAFFEGPPRAYDLRAITADLGASYQRVRLDSVGSECKYVRLSSGARLSYDSLVLAVGARARSSISGALTFRDQRDVPLFGRLLEDLRAGSVRRLVFAVPAGVSWSIPMFELALLSRSYARRHGRDVEITVVSPERRPLDVFGPEACGPVEDLLDDRDVRFVGTAAAATVERDGAVMLLSGERIEADRVVAAPQLRGQQIAGVPAGRWGFVPTDDLGRVDGLPAVYAAGDMRTFPIKQAGLATQQADRVAYRIAEDLGTCKPGPMPRHILQARLLGGDRSMLLRAELDEDGTALDATLGPGDADPASGRAKVFARYLTPYLSAHRPLPDAPLVAA